MTKDTGGPAFPVPANAFNDMEGMTLRDYFAAQALPVVCEDYSPAGAALLAYEYADAMLKARQA